MPRAKQASLTDEMDARQDEAAALAETESAAPETAQTALATVRGDVGLGMFDEAGGNGDYARLAAQAAVQGVKLEDEDKTTRGSQDVRIKIAQGTSKQEWTDPDGATRCAADYPGKFYWIDQDGLPHLVDKLNGTVIFWWRRRAYFDDGAGPNSLPRCSSDDCRWGQWREGEDAVRPKLCATCEVKPFTKCKPVCQNGAAIVFAVYMGPEEDDDVHQVELSATGIKPLEAFAKSLEQIEVKTVDGIERGIPVFSVPVTIATERKKTETATYFVPVFYVGNSMWPEERIAEYRAQHRLAKAEIAKKAAQASPAESSPSSALPGESEAFVCAECRCHTTPEDIGGYTNQGAPICTTCASRGA